MKITILSTAYPLRGGIAHFIGLLFKELNKNHEVKVITFKRQYPSILFPGKSQLEEGDSVDSIPTEVMLDSINPFNWIKVGLRVKKDSPDVLIFKYWMPFFAPCFGTISRIANRNKKTRILVICDNVIPHERKPGDILLTRYFFNAVDYFILLSEKVEKDLLSLLPKSKSKVLPHPIYSNFGLPISKKEAKSFLKIKDERVILFFGFIRDYKGLDILLEAMAFLKDRLDVKLLIAGEFYSNREKYLSLIDSLGIKENILMFSDFIPTSEVKYYFSAVDSVILPYRDATQSGIVQIAMNFRKPVIAANVGGLSEVIKDGETGYIVDKENPAILAEAIIKFYEDKKEEMFVSNIEREVEKYSWGKFVDGMMGLIG